MLEERFSECSLPEVATRRADRITATIVTFIVSPQWLNDFECLKIRNEAVVILWQKIYQKQTKFDVDI